MKSALRCGRLAAVLPDGDLLPELKSELPKTNLPKPKLLLKAAKVLLKFPRPKSTIRTIRYRADRNAAALLERLPDLSGGDAAPRSNNSSKHRPRGRTKE